MKTSELNPKHPKIEVSVETGCWVWTGFCKPRGYGQATVDGVRGLLLHRAAWVAAHGPIPEGLTVDHICFNPPCVNPAHLRLLTHLANSRNQRSSLADRCIHGHDFDEENTYWRPSGSRQCRACNREAVRRASAKRRRVKS